ncbi:MAG: DUF2505 domain-containing protein [Polyangiaceae bacterium]|nr:DUF2505 domain-containing protein [Polyangiaceae bacterium]
MRLTVHQEFPAPPDVLWSVFSDREYPGAKYRALGATRFEMPRFTATDDEICVDLSRTIPVDLAKIPGFARKLVGDEQTMRHETRWRRSAGAITATLVITPVGRPVKIGGTASVSAEGDGARLTFELEVTSDVPLIGGKIAQIFADQVQAALAADHAFTRRYLAEKRAG